MDLCDAHLHYGDAALMRKMTEESPLRAQYPCYQTVQFSAMNRYEEELRNHGVTACAVIPFVFREADAGLENRRVLEFAAGRPEQIFPYALLDEEDTSFVDRRYREIVGIKEHFVREKSVLTSAKKQIFEQVRAHGLTLLLHSQRQYRREYVGQLLSAFPGMKIQIAHMGRGVPGDTSMIFEMLEAFAPYDCVTFDTSTVRDSAVLERAVNLVGADRILYGSDFPFYTGTSAQEDIMGRQIRHVLEAKLTDVQREKIFEGNFKARVSRGV